ncbi:MAG: hypothetical protein CMO55_01855 [Verrucomicrobiales bacterium]|nr:hypothetical protein [Verrucomicrobiales bacterium]
MEIYRYTLRSAESLNAQSERQEHEGVLVRYKRGVGCIHPWPELGDLSLSQQIACLQSGTPTPLIDQALRCAEIDGQARERGESLFTDPIPRSHWLALPGDNPQEVKSYGFDRVKIKIGKNLVEEERIIAGWASEGFSIRLDCNDSLSVTAMVEFWYSIRFHWPRVELIEDPVPWNPEDWRVLREVGIPLAVDRDAENRFRPDFVAVLKPAVSDWLPETPARYFVTSYMDHAIGQYWAAYKAMSLKNSDYEGLQLACGLLTHRCFESDPFFDRIDCDGCRLLPVGGTGLGFDDLLDSLPWKHLD